MLNYRLCLKIMKFLFVCALDILKSVHKLYKKVPRAFLMCLIEITTRILDWMENTKMIQNSPVSGLCNCARACMCVCCVPIQSVCVNNVKVFIIPKYKIPLQIVQPAKEPKPTMGASFTPAQKSICLNCKTTKKVMYYCSDQFKPLLQHKSIWIQTYIFHY
jgi:hypothetical protein